MKKIVLIAHLQMLFLFSSTATDLITIRNMYSGTPVALPAGTIITATVISDRINNNTPAQNAIVQDYTAGICLRADAVHSLNMNDSLTVDVSGDTLSEFNGLLQITHVDFSSATMNGIGAVTPRTATVEEILDNMSGTLDSWESTLVRIVLATITNDATGIYSGSDTITDATDNMILFTRSQATFANNALPQGVVNVTGLVTEFLIPEIAIRNLDDVEVNPSVPEYGWASAITVFPNPATNEFFIEFEDGSGMAEARIYESTGRLLNKYQIESSNRFQIRTEGFDAGVYYVQIVKDKGAVTIPLAVMNY